MARENVNKTYSTPPDSLRRAKGIPLDQRIIRLVELMRVRVKEGRPLNFSEPTHREITEALHILAYEKPDPGQPDGNTRLKVSYGDGSNPRPLRVRCLSVPPIFQVESNKALHVGTLSFRHLDYDDYVDVYLIRDRETRMRTAGEIDDLAYRRMKEILEDPVMEQDGSQIIIYQAGLEPLAVGMYRAIIEHLLDRRRKALPILTIQPKFYVDEHDERARGPLWA
jgi:hypothetical protein